VVARITEVGHGTDPVQGYCDFLHHRMELATARGEDVPNDETFDSWAASGFPGIPLPG
jgi:hypothetical protein